MLSVGFGFGFGRIWTVRFGLDSVSAETEKLGFGLDSVSAETEKPGFGLDSVSAESEKNGFGRPIHQRHLIHCIVLH